MWQIKAPVNRHPIVLYGSLFGVGWSGHAEDDMGKYLHAKKFAQTGQIHKWIPLSWIVKPPRDSPLLISQPNTHTHTHTHVEELKCAGRKTTHVKCNLI